MISGSVAVEGQGRGLGQVLGQPTPVPEFLRPLPRAAPYGRYHPHSHIPHSSHHLQQQQQQQQQHQAQQSHLARHREEEESHSSPLGYPFMHNPFLPYYGSYHPPAPVPLPQPTPVAPIPTPAPAPPPVPTAMQPQSPTSAPRGKEGSLKHRLLSRERPPPLGHFSRGALIQLGSGQLRRVEDMSTEDFVMSADSNPDMRLVQSTVVKLHRPTVDKILLTLSYNGNRSQVDIETSVERPFFVYGHGWASCLPERTLQCYGLQVGRLQVGDVCVSLIRRENPLPTTPLSHLPPSPFGSLPPPLSHPFHQPTSATIVTTATTTAMSSRPADDPQCHPENLSLREDSRKRRWSAPDICDEDGAKKSRTLVRH